MTECENTIFTKIIMETLINERRMIPDDRRGGNAACSGWDFLTGKVDQGLKERRKAEAPDCTGASSFFGMEKEYDVWKMVGVSTYRCGCCGRIPVFVDIRDLTICPHCEHVMNFYETENGIAPIRKDGSIWRNKIGTMDFGNEEEAYVVVKAVKVG